MGQVILIHKGIKGTWNSDGTITVGNKSYPDRVSFKCHVDRLSAGKKSEVSREMALWNSIQKAEKLLND
jgi:hypothetical protein